MSKKQIFWFSLLGLILGSSLGLVVAWIVAPVQYVDTDPSTLRVDFKDEYRLLIASAYASNTDLLRARARLGILADRDSFAALGEQAQRMMASNASTDDIQMLANLSQDLRNTPIVVLSPTPDATSTETAAPTSTMSSTPSPTSSPTSTATDVPTDLSPTLTATFTASPTATFTPTITPKPIATLAPRPTQTLTPTPAKAFVMVKKTAFCDPATPGLLQINLTNAAGKPAAGIELDITWLGGDETFFSGLKPELGYGYADFTMLENTEYALSLSGGGTRVTSLTTAKCTDPHGGTYPGGIHLELKQP